MSLADQQLSYSAIERLVSTLNQARRGDFSVRMAAKGEGMEAEVADAVNELLTLQGSVVAECERLAESITLGELHDRASVQGADQDFDRQLRAVNTLVSTFARHASELRRVSKAMHAGDFSRAVTTGPDSNHRGGELLRVAEEVNGLLSHLERIASEVSRVAAEVGLDGNLGTQIHVGDVSGSWAMVVGGVNAMSASLAEQVQDLSAMAEAIGKGQLAARSSVACLGAMQGLKLGLNGAADAMAGLCGELRRVAQEVVSEGKLTAELRHPNPIGEWQTAQEAINRAFGEHARVTQWASRGLRSMANSHFDLPPIEASGDLSELTEGLIGLARAERENEAVLEGLVEGRFPEQASAESRRAVTLFRLSLRLKREWFRAARGSIVEAALSRRREDFAHAALAFIADTVSAEVGAFYFSESVGRLTLVASLGLSADSMPEAEIRFGHGLVGKVAQSGEPVVLRDLSPERVRIRSGLVEIIPRALLVCPLRAGGDVVGVVELAFTEGDPDLARELLEFLSLDLGDAAVSAFRLDSRAAAQASDESRALGEELAIATARIERLTRELALRDKVVRDLQQEATALREERAS